VNDNVEIVGDDTGVAIFGEPAVVERFVNSIASLKDSTKKGSSRAIAIGAAVTQAGVTAASQSGRWIKLTTESAAELKKAGGLMPTDTPGVSYAMLGSPGKIKKWITVDSSATARLSNPALLANAAAVMSQVAMQQQIDAIVDYLEEIDKKIDSVLRTQVNQVMARLDGAYLAIEECIAVRNSVGRVSEVTWSKVQAVSQTINEVQSFAIRQMGELVERLDVRKISELLTATQVTESDMRKWLTVIARCFELHEQAGLLEIGRVLNDAPEELNQHRLGLQAARSSRINAVQQATERILEQLQSAIDAANSKVLFNPIQSPKVVTIGNQVATEILGLWQLLGVETGYGLADVNRWSAAAGEKVERVRQLGTSSAGTARTAANRVRELLPDKRTDGNEHDA